MGQGQPTGRIPNYITELEVLVQIKSDKIYELQTQLDELKPYLHHTGNCTKTKSFKVNADCSCGLRDILEKDDG